MQTVPGTGKVTVNRTDGSCPHGVYGLLRQGHAINNFVYTHTCACGSGHAHTRVHRSQYALKEKKNKIKLSEGKEKCSNVLVWNCCGEE